MKERKKMLIWSRDRTHRFHTKDIGSQLREDFVKRRSQFVCLPDIDLPICAQYINWSTWWSKTHTYTRPDISDISDVSFWLWTWPAIWQWRHVSRDILRLVKRVAGTGLPHPIPITYQYLGSLLVTILILHAYSSPTTIYSTLQTCVKFTSQTKSLVSGTLWITYFQREELETFSIFLFGLLREWYFVICWLAPRWAFRRDQRWSLSEKSSYISCQVMSHRSVYDTARKKKERNEICICELDFIPYNKVNWIWTVQDKFAIQEISCIYFAKYRVAKCHRYGRYIYVKYWKVGVKSDGDHTVL